MDGRYFIDDEADASDCDDHSDLEDYFGSDAEEAANFINDEEEETEDEPEERREPGETIETENTAPTMQNREEISEVETSRNRKRGWVFTLNNPSSEEIPREWQADFCAWQVEQGEMGTIHLQGWCYFKSPKSFQYMKKLNGDAHWEIQRGSNDQAYAYVTKEESRLRGPFEYGERFKKKI